MTWYVLYCEQEANVMHPTEERVKAIERACNLLAEGCDVREIGCVTGLSQTIDAAEIRRIWESRAMAVPA
jgi:hypothetical protein